MKYCKTGTHRLILKYTTWAMCYVLACARYYAKSTHSDLHTQKPNKHSSVHDHLKALFRLDGPLIEEQLKAVRFSY